MADRGTVGAGARTGWPATGTVKPASPVGITGGLRLGAIAKTTQDGFPQPVNPLLHRRVQMYTGSPLLTSD